MGKPKGRPDIIDQQIGENLRTIRRFRGLSQAALAEKIDVSFQQIQKYEKGTNRISGSTFVKISNALQVPITALFQGTGQDGTTWVIPRVSKRLNDVLNLLSEIDDGEIEKSLLAVLKHHTKH